MNQPDKKDLIIKILLLVIVILVSIITAWYFSAQPSPPRSMGGNVSGMGAMPMGMTLKTYDLKPSDPVPTIDFDIAKDPLGGGWNLHIITTHFIFTPENENKAPVADQGHAHLYIDGMLSVVYGPWYHFDDLSPGQHTITVSLNANDHSVFALNGVYIKKEKVITQ